MRLDAAAIRPHVSWGTNPAQVVSIDGEVPSPDDLADSPEREAAARALSYMGLVARTPIRAIEVDTVFIGSCTNSRIEDLRTAAAVLAGRRIRPGLRALVVPGSRQVKHQAEAEGLDRVFIEAGFEWRESRLLDVSRDEPRPTIGRANDALPPRTAISRAGRDGAVAPISSRRPSPPPPRSRVASPTPADLGS